MKKRNIIIGLLIWISLAVHAQGLDSLYSAFAKAKGTARMLAGLEIARWIDAEGYVVDSCLLEGALSEKKFESELTALATRHLFREEYYQQALEAAHELKQLSEAARDTSLLIESYYFMGFANQRMGKMDEGLLYAQKCYDLALACNNREMLSSVLNNMGNIYMVNGQDSMAVVYFKQSLNIERLLERKSNQAIRLGNISIAYMKQNKLDEALAAALEGLELDRLHGSPNKLAIRYQQAGKVYMAMEDYEKAKAYELEALRYFSEANSAYGQSVVLNSLGELETKLNNHRVAAEHFDRALLFAESLGNNLLVQKICYNLYHIYKEKNPGLALTYFEKHTALKDSVFHADNQKQLNEFQVKYDTRRKELEIISQKAEIDRHRHNRTMLIVGLAFSLSILFFLGIIVRQRSKRNRELAGINATKDKLFSIISHDLKNPAIAQRNALRALVEHEGRFDDSTLAQYHNELLRSADCQVELLYNLLNWAQVQTGGMPFNPSTFDLAALSRQEADLVRSMAEHKGVELNCDLPDEALIDGDRNMYAIVIRNLLANAVKFTHRGGKVVLALSSSQGYYILSVSDTGIGMTPEQLSDLFSIEHVRTTSGTTGEQGSGLGLIVCKELLKKHGARFEVESTKGEGSRFVVYIRE